MSVTYLSGPPTSFCRSHCGLFLKNSVSVSHLRLVPSPEGAHRNSGNLQYPSPLHTVKNNIYISCILSWYYSKLPSAYEPQGDFSGLFQIICKAELCKVTKISFCKGHFGMKSIPESVYIKHEILHGFNFYIFTIS